MPFPYSTQTMLPRPLASRPADFVYFIFFVSHVFASLLMDFQALYPPSLVPATLASLPINYVKMSGDPLIGSALGLPGFASPMLWFHSFLIREYTGRCIYRHDPDLPMRQLKRMFTPPIWLIIYWAIMQMLSISGIFDWHIWSMERSVLYQAYA